ncbi:anhydro-N-acetylmuramic acid kinase [Ornithinicoccus halotolerans]|uniref:anhydro-N-acetylmuramic acid kinase n=1 Tax=Ornithinicoccus halotolerans TaxID=1748220 RepID=UPI0012960B38|nr:anhydro-N-acetylmuramic acid kinase [Ornithinicoccus halotolerans]
MIVLALSSGTSVDGIDVAAADLELTGDRVLLTPLGYHEQPWSSALQEEVLAALPPAGTSLEQVCRLDTELGQELGQAARAAVDRLRAGGQGEPELVVSHGQTLYHWVEPGSTERAGQVRGTLQLGQPAWIAEATGLPVVSDVRTADVAAGGQGAPLASTLDALLLGDLTDRGPAAALNLGGIGNVTVVGAPGTPVAFDTGPANALLDAAVRLVTDGVEHVDRDGALAAAGTVDQALLQQLLAHPYYRRQPPKSTGKENFHGGYLQEQLAAHTRGSTLTGPDLLATLVELTARTVAAALDRYRVTQVLASGGGTRNPVLMARLAHHLGPARLGTTDEVGLDPHAKEAYLFALLGFLTWNGLPGTLPGCTGAGAPRVAGRITPGHRPLRLPEPATTVPTRLEIV